MNNIQYYIDEQESSYWERTSTGLDYIQKTAERYAYERGRFDEKLQSTTSFKLIINWIGNLFSNIRFGG